MRLHGNAKLGLAGRFALVQACEQGLSMREVARRFGVSPATVCRWHGRWRRASGGQRCSLACLLDRPSRPRHMPRLLPADVQRRICAARQCTGWGPRLLTVRTGYSHSTISKVLARHGLSRPLRAAREPARRYEWPSPGDLLHMDVSHYARFTRPGHALTGDRSSTAAEKRAIGRLRVRARDRRRSLAPRLRRAPRGRACPFGDRLPRTSAHLLRRTRDQARAADDGQQLELHAQPLTARAPSSARNRARANAQATTAAQRQGRALPPNDGERVGLRRPLPLLSTPRRRAATLARLLQRAQTAQLARRPTTDQPCSQRLWAEQLDAGCHDV